MAMHVDTSRFGLLNLKADDAICFPMGLPGFEECCGWVLLVDDTDCRVGWLQSTDWPDIALPVVEPRNYVPEFEVKIDQREMASLGLQPGDDTQVLVIVSKHDERLTLNLKAPLVINPKRRLGRQVIHGGEWSIQHAIGDEPMRLRKIA